MERETNPVRWPALSHAAGEPGVGVEPQGAVGHSGVTNGPPEDPPDKASHNYENPDSGTSQENPWRPLVTLG